MRPHQSGAALQNNLDLANPGHTYGGNDYHGTAFVMMKKERNGRTRIHHQEDARPRSYGSRYLRGRQPCVHTDEHRQPRRDEGSAGEVRTALGTDGHVGSKSPLMRPRIPRAIKVRAKTA